MGLLNKDDLDYYLSQLGAYFAIMLRDNPGDLYKELYSHYDAVREHIQTIEETNGWISVKDRLPTESDGTVLICYPNKSPYNLMEPHVNARHNRRVATGHYSQHARTWYHGDFNAVGGADPIAWMPLPEPPKEET